MNSVQLVGRLGADPESRTANSGTAITNLRIATSRKYKGEEQTQWHRVVCFGKTAEVAAAHLSKGRQVGIEGRIEYRQWEKDGVTRWSTEIICNQLHFISDGSGRSGGGNGGGGPSNYGGGGGGYGGPQGDDIPFVHVDLDETRVLS